MEGAPKLTVKCRWEIRKSFVDALLKGIFQLKYNQNKLVSGVCRKCYTIKNMTSEMKLELYFNSTIVSIFRPLVSESQIPFSLLGIRCHIFGLRFDIPSVPWYKFFLADVLKTKNYDLECEGFCLSEICLSWMKLLMNL